MKTIIEETMKCVRCGNCKAFCPTYLEGLSEAVSARGRVILIKNLIESRLKPSARLSDDIYSCLLCEACKVQCPLSIDVTSIIYEGRRLLVASDQKRRGLRWLLRLMSRYPQFAFRLSRLCQDTLYPYLYRKGIIPFRLNIPRAPLKDEHQVLRPDTKKGRVAIFVGCSTNYIFPHLGLSLINVLLRMGYEVILPKGEVCCGAPFRELGLHKDAVRMAKRNLSIFGKLNVEAILTLCPTCLLSIRYQYEDLIGEVIDNAQDVSKFLLDRLGDIELKEPDLETVSYHDPCHHINSMGIMKEPRELLNRAGLRIIEMDESGCCGFAGLFSLGYRELSRVLLQKRVASFRKTGAEALVTSCPGCILQLSREIDDTPIYHIIEVIEMILNNPNLPAEN
ncbi:MAG: (Fe-S)-binding protein [Thermodesulfovibrionales bacterium]